MTTEFSYETVFRAPSTTTILEAYFNPDHLATQDKVALLGDRTVISDEDDGKVRTTSWRVVSLNPLPMFVRPFVEGGRLSYVETMMWRRADDEIDMTIQPQIAGGRVQIAATYTLRKVGDGQISRRYKGNVSVAVKLLSGKIERAIIEQIEKGMPMMTACTQGWLDRNVAG